MSIIFNNGWLLASALLGVALCALLAILIIKKMYKRFAYVMLTLTLCVSIGACVYSGIVLDEKRANDEVIASLSGTSYPTKNEYIAAFGGFMLEGAYEEAESIVTDYSSAYGYDSECSRMTARLAYANEDYFRALAIYQKIEGDALSEEALAAQKIVIYQQLQGTESVQSEVLPMSFTTGTDTADDSNMVLTPDTDISVETASAEELLSGGAMIILTNALSDIPNVEDYREAAVLLAEVEAAWESGMGTTDAEELSDRIEEAPRARQLNKMSVWRVGRLKVRLLSEDFDTVLEEMDEFATCEEYTVVAELYVNDKISGKELKSAFGVKGDATTQKVLEQLKSIEKGGSLGKEELATVKAQIEKLSVSSDGVNYHIESRLLLSAKDISNIRKNSKIYYTLSEFTQKNDQEQQSNIYFSDALVNAANSDDAAYAEAMNGIANIISGTGDRSAIMDIGALSEAAVNNSSLIKGSENIIRSPEKVEEMKSEVQEYAIKASSAITINKINTENFDTVEVTIQLSDEFLSEDELINMIALYDCTLDITEFTVDKIEVDHANVILCCDNSGSMNSAIYDLKAAVRTFLDTVGEKERIGLYTFDDYLLQSLPVGTPMDQIYAGVEQMYARGGTNIGGSIQTILKNEPIDTNANNTLILMTDGQDSTLPGYIDEVRRLVEESGYVIYILGMGSGIDSNSLSRFADEVGGQFVFSPSTEELESLYAFIHGQVQNRYRITFTAKDTLSTSNRILRIELKEQGINATKVYSLNTGSDDPNAGGSTDNNSFTGKLSVSGFETKVVLKSSLGMHIDIKGTGFTPDSTMLVSLIGDRTYELRATYIDETTFRITLPNEIAIGAYDAKLQIGGRMAYLQNELIVSDGSTTTVRFGRYEFEALKVTKSDYRTTLIGNVVMNGWLHFNGSVTLEGDLDSGSVQLVDHYGSYVSYAKAQNATGLAKFYKEKGISQWIPMLGSATIYASNEPLSDYPAQKQTLFGFDLLEFMEIGELEFAIYPDRFELTFDNAAPKLPFQELLLTSPDGSPISFDCKCTGTVSASNIALAGEAAINYLDPQYTLTVMLLRNEAQLRDSLLGIKFDTAKGSFDLQLLVDLPFLPFESGLDLQIGWKDMAWNALSLTYKGEHTAFFGPVPVTFSDFKLGVTGIAEKTKNASKETVSAIALEGGVSIDAYELSAIIPYTEWLFGDISLLSIPDAKLSCGLQRFSIDASASLELLKAIKLGNASLKLGNYKYSNGLLNLSDVDVCGIYGSVTQGPSADFGFIDLSVTGTTEVSINEYFIGVKGVGSVSVGVDLLWGAIDFGTSGRGEALIGMYTDFSGDSSLTIRTSVTGGSGKRSGFIVNINDDFPYIHRG